METNHSRSISPFGFESKVTTERHRNRAISHRAQVETEISDGWPTQRRLRPVSIRGTNGFVTILIRLATVSRLISVPWLMKPGRTTGQRGEFEVPPPCVNGRGREREKENRRFYAPSTRVIDAIDPSCLPTSPISRRIRRVVHQGSRMTFERRDSFEKREEVRFRGEEELNNPCFATPVYFNVSEFHRRSKLPSLLFQKASPLVYHHR